MARYNSKASRIIAANAARIEELYASGETLKSLGKMLGVSHESVRTYLNERGLISGRVVKKKQYRPKRAVTQEVLKERMHYNPATGIFTSLYSGHGMTKGRKLGRVNYNSRTGKSYLHIAIFSKNYLAHRLAWLYMTGEWPDHTIDHIDGDGLNNRWDNLREATQSQNSWNRKRQSNNTTGYKGVSFDRRSGSYRASICIEGRKITRQNFPTAEEAYREYLRMAREYFGEFARAA